MVVNFWLFHDGFSIGIGDTGVTDPSGGFLRVHRVLSGSRRSGWLPPSQVAGRACP